MGPAALEELIAAFARLPGIGHTSAQRLAFYVIKTARQEADGLAQAIRAARDRIGYCARCFNFTEREVELCAVCRDPRRDPRLICVVEEASDVLAFERNQLFRGRYHVLGGALSPLKGVHPEDLRIEELVARVKEEEVSEVILAFNTNVESDATAEYISQKLSALAQVTSLARGLPVGADLDLADKMTLAHALQGRHSF